MKISVLLIKQNHWDNCAVPMNRIQLTELVDLFIWGLNTHVLFVERRG